MANELMRRALYERAYGGSLQHANKRTGTSYSTLGNTDSTTGKHVFREEYVSPDGVNWNLDSYNRELTVYTGDAAKKKQAQDQADYAAREKAAHDFAVANSSANQKAGADAARSAASATSTRDAARSVSSKEAGYQASKAQQAAASRSAADAVANARRNAISSAAKSAAEAQAAASKQSTKDASKKRMMDWNNPSDAGFSAWKKNYNHQYYMDHLKEWQEGGKYYYDYKKGQLDSEMRPGGSGRYYVDSATGEKKLKKGFYIDPMTGKVLDLRNASSEARAAMEELQKTVSRGGSPANDAELRRTYEGILNENRKAQNLAKQAQAEKQRVMSSVGLRGVRPGRADVDVAIDQPNFVDELKKSAKNFARNASKAGKKVKDVSANAISKGKEFISNLTKGRR